MNYSGAVFGHHAIGYMIAHIVLKAIIYGLVFKAIAALGLWKSLFVGLIIIGAIAYGMRGNGARRTY